MRVGFVCGLERERRCLVRGWGHHYAAPPLAAVGMGPDAAERAAREVIGQGADAVLAFGFCGGLDPRLPPCALIVPESVGDGTAATELASGPLRRELAGEGGRLLSVARPLADLDAKIEAAAQGFAAVDMESWAVVRAAAAAGIDCWVVRAVADPATRPLPQVARVAVGEDGRLRPLAIAAALSGRPRDWPLVWRTAQDARAAEASLRRAAATLARLAGEGRL